MNQITYPSKVVFALTAQGNDLFSAMTRVAVASLRVSNPEILVMIVCDRKSHKSMQRVADPLIEEVDECIAIDTPEGDAGFRNRYVKTRLRQIVDGPFLFLDSDTFVRGDISEIFALNVDIAGAPNHSRLTIDEQIWAQDAETITAMNWQVSPEVYLNGGVVFYNDTPNAQSFGEEFHRRWLQSNRMRGGYRDQPAFNSALKKIQPSLAVLSDRFNAQVKTNIYTARNAAIWHFYYSYSRLPSFFHFDIIANHVLETGQIRMKDVQDLVKSDVPWREVFWLDRLVGKRVSLIGTTDGWEIVWLSGFRSRCVVQLVKIIFGKCLRVPSVFIKSLYRKK